MDSGDKATNKAMSIAYKYACFQVFCIPTEEMMDPDAEILEPAPKTSKQTKSDKVRSSVTTQSTQSPKAEQTPVPTPEQMAEIEHQKINAAKIAVIRKELERTGVNEQAICTRYKFEKLEDCTEGLFVKVMNALKNTKSKGE